MRSRPTSRTWIRRTLGSSRPSLLAAVTVCGVASAALAQGGAPLVLAGRVVRVTGRDSLPVAGAFVVGHHVGTQRQGPVDSVRTDAAGRFRIVVARPDTAGLYVISTRYQGIGYFATPVEPGDPAGAGTMVLAVYDTSSSGPPLSLAMRHIVVTVGDSDGSHRVMDILQVHNGGTTTRVAADSTAATWRVLLPAGIEEVRPGEGEVSPAAVTLEGERLAVAAPFPPGDKQVVVTYVVPRGTRTLRIPVDQPTARIEFLFELPGVEASGAGIRAVEPMVLEGRTLRRFTAEGVAAGAEITVGLGAAGDAGRRFTWVVVVVAGATLAAGLFLGLRRRGAGQTAEAPVERSDPEALATLIAALDERYEGREADTPPDQWLRYTARRAELTERLRAALARGGSS